MVGDLAERAGSPPVTVLVDSNADATGFRNQRTVRGVSQVSAERVRLVASRMNDDRADRTITGIRVFAYRSACEIDEFGEIGFNLPIE